MLMNETAAKPEATCKQKHTAKYTKNILPPFVSLANRI